MSKTPHSRSKGVDIILSAPRGFCAGVVRAVDIVELSLERFGNPLYVRHEIVHNPHVVESLRQKGAIFVEELNEVPDNQTVVFSAHGVAPRVWDEAHQRNLTIVDATCPLVTKVHLESIKYARENYSVIVVGHEGHPEVIGTMGQSPKNSSLVGTAAEAEQVEVRDPDRVVALTQTTLSVGDTQAIISVLKRRFPNLIARNDICYATTNRQEAAKELAQQVDVVLVIGAQNSSNCNRLREVAAAMGVAAYLVAGPEELDLHWLEGAQRVGITSGASTPESSVESVISHLAPASVTTLEVTKEDVSFVLPQELQRVGDKWAHAREEDADPSPFRESSLPS
jgi:4-hydroxy-3-methylbut-2-enyl diphosphate reductase